MSSPSAPSWPRLAAAAADPDVRTLRARWRTVEPGRERTGVVLWRRADALLVVLDENGARRPHDDLGLLPLVFEHGARTGGQVSPPRLVRHDGRDCWAVELLPPGDEAGLLTVVVDDATGLCVSKADTSSASLRELISLEPDVALCPFDLAAAPAPVVQTQDDRVQARYDYARLRPAPTPRYFPARRVRLEDPGVLNVYGEREDGWISWAPLGEQAPMNFWGGEHVHRFQARGLAWAVCTPQPVPLEEAQEVIRRLEDLPG